MHRLLIRYRLVPAFAALCFAGCQTLFDSEPATSDTLLRAARPSADAVTLDIYWANVPPIDAAAEADLWRFVQEDRLDSELRRRLAENGLRAGVVGGVPPAEIVRLLDPRGDHVGKTGSEAGDDGVATLGESTGVARKTVQLRPEQPLEIKASELLDETPLLAANGKSAEMLRDAQAFYQIRVLRASSGGYAVELTPELQTGDARWKWTPDDTGMFSRQKPLRDKRVFADLRLEAPLVVGEMLIVTGRPDAAEGLLGRHLHRSGQEAEGDSRAILIRLTHSPPSDAFAFNVDDAAASY